MKVLLILLFLTVPAFGQAQITANPGLSVSGVRWYVENFIRIMPATDMQKVNDGLTQSADPMSMQLRSNEYFVYEGIFKNTSGKKISAFSWEHIFSAIDSGKELKRHRFYHPFPFQTGKTKKVRREVKTPPTELISIENLKKNGRSPYRESIQINCILFDDNSTWSNALASPTECDNLRSDIKAREAWLKSYR